VAEFIEVPGAQELQNGQMKMFKIGNKEVLLARVGDSFYAADNRCPHMGGKLSEGKLEKTVVTCPRHNSRFDLTDGHVVRWTDWSGVLLSLSRVVRAPRPINTYRVRVEGGKILVESEKAPAMVT
jgi:3-phenylpropionate/trans-cinnamate dioxygenase ferredoxin subunit